MKKYIDAEAFKRKLIDEKSFFPAIVARALEEMPAADVGEVHRCKDCANFDEYVFCVHMGLDGFCSYGERKEKNDFKE